MAFLLWQQPFQTKGNLLITPVEQPLVIVVKEPIQPLPLQLDLDINKIKLGEKLFYDSRLSGNNTISCASCHNLNTGGTDRLTRSLGINNHLGSVNAPTVFNSGFNIRQFWDGRAKTPEEQIDGPLNNPKEMGSNWLEVVSKLEQDPEYVSLFAQNYKDKINSMNIKNALGTFVRSLYTPNSRFDQFLRGNQDILTAKEKEGYYRFKAYGCVSCHQGINVGGNMFQAFGVMGNYFSDRGDLTTADKGRFNITTDKQDLYMFKVPGLRNVALTPPYFHDGSAKTLEDAVAVMAKYQLGRRLSQEDIDLIVSFLKTLTGQYKGKPL